MSYDYDYRRPRAKTDCPYCDTTQGDFHLVGCTFPDPPSGLSRLLRSALFPLIVIVIIVYLVSVFYVSGTQ